MREMRDDDMCSAGIIDSTGTASQTPALFVEIYH